MRDKPYTYKQAIVKFNNGAGALLCNDCGVILATGTDHEDRVHLCDKCEEKRGRIGTQASDET